MTVSMNFSANGNIDDKKADELFFLNYFIDFWKYKIQTISMSWQIFQDKKANTELQNSDYKSFLHLEAIFLQHHIIEALLELHNVLYRQPSHIVKNLYLRKVKQPSQTAQQITKGNLLESTTLKKIYYLGDNKTSCEQIEKIGRDLVTLSKIYLDRDFYNAFKHSMRIMPKKDDAKLILRSEQTTWAFNIPNVIVTFQLDSEKIQMKARNVEFNQILVMVNRAYSLLQAIVNPRKEYYKNERRKHQGCDVKKLS
ncbi:MAG: hypothetical protein K8R90_10460 [Candidatus Cloacimonetes bacterium]|nr:hypothetical protein [Candidatus Cloacimonadota bacterium]